MYVTTWLVPGTVQSFREYSVIAFRDYISKSTYWCGLKKSENSVVFTKKMTWKGQVSSKKSCLWRVKQISKKPKCINQYCEDFLGIVWDCVDLIKLCVFTPTHPVWSPVIIRLVVMTQISQCKSEALVTILIIYSHKNKIMWC